MSDRFLSGRADDRPSRPHGQALLLQMRAMRPFLADGKHASSEALCRVQERILADEAGHVEARQTAGKEGAMTYDEWKATDTTPEPEREGYCDECEHYECDCPCCNPPECPTCGSGPGPICPDCGGEPDDR